MKIILTCAKNLIIALEIRKNVRNNEIDSITKIIAMISFIYFNKSRMKRAMI